MTFLGTLELELDVDCDLGDPSNPQIRSVEFHGVDITKALKKKQLIELALQAKEMVETDPDQIP